MTAPMQDRDANALSVPAPRAMERAPADKDLRDTINQAKAKGGRNRGNRNKGKADGRQTEHKPGKKGRNTQDFAPSTTPPGLKLVVGNPRKPTLGKQMHGRHVTYVPGFFCDEEETEVFGKLMAEVRAAGSPEMWVPWHEKSHFIANDRERHGKWKDDSPVFCAVIEKIARYFEMDVKATRFNWYRNAEEWKPYHHDAAAVKKDKAKTQNCTIAVSFGATRDVAFEHAKTKTTVFLPQTHGSAYCFGHDVNVEWRHGVPQVPEALRGAAAGANEERVSIIAWGWVDQNRNDLDAFAN